jgi:hypothetical protein
MTDLEKLTFALSQSNIPFEVRPNYADPAFSKVEAQGPSGHVVITLFDPKGTFVNSYTTDGIQVVYKDS